LHRVMHDGGEVLVLPLAAGEADEGEPRGEETAVGEVVYGGQQLLAGEVARDAEDDERARSGDAIEAPVVGVAERVVAAMDGSWHGFLMVAVDRARAASRAPRANGEGPGSGRSARRLQCVGHGLLQVVPRGDELLHALVLE